MSHSLSELHHNRRSSEFITKPDCVTLLSFSVRPEDKGKRLDVYLSETDPALSRSQIVRLIDDGKVQVNNKRIKSSYRTKPHDHITVEIPPPAPLELKPEKVAFEVIYEDEDIMVLSKPAGVVVHPGAGHKEGTLVHGLLEHCQTLSGIGGVLRPGIVHRLDRDTSGLLVVAKSDRAHQQLSGQFKTGRVNKKYVALVYGTFQEKEGLIERPIGRHPVHRKKMSVQAKMGREARTLWKVLKASKDISLLEITIHTGRTHQIRVHLASIAHPVVGDSVYGGKQEWMRIQHPGVRQKVKTVQRQMLHARELGFVHPVAGRYMEFFSPLPSDMKKLIGDLW